jgi:hypothetical protein
MSGTKQMVFDVRREERYREADFAAKQKNFYGVMKYIHTYPTRTQMSDVLGMSHTSFYRTVSPTLFGMARDIDFLEWVRHSARTECHAFISCMAATILGRPRSLTLSLTLSHIHTPCSLAYSLADSLSCTHVTQNLRLWDYNRGEYFPERVLQSFDGFPVSVCGSSNNWVRRLTKSKKYQVRSALVAVL